MAICKLNRNLTKSDACGYSLPQIVDIYVINKDSLSGDLATAIAVSYGTGDSIGCDEVSGISLNSGEKVYHIEPQKNSASFEDTLVVEDNGNKHRHAQVTFTVPGTYNSCMHGNLDALSLGAYVVVLKTADGNYILLGRISPLEAETATLAGGSDNNGVQIVLSGDIAESPLPMNQDAIDVLLANVAS